jgi:hypothetical protein
MPRYEKRHRDTVGSQGPVAASGGLASPPRTSYAPSARLSRARRVCLRVSTPQGVKVAGYLEYRGDQVVLVKRVEMQRHLLQRPEPSWAVDAEGLRQAQALGADRVEIREAERGDVWHSPLDYVLRRGRVFDRGWGEQVALPLYHWSFRPARKGGRLELPF